MQLPVFVSKTKFNILASKYFEQTGLPLVLVDLNGDVVYSLKTCGMCHELIGKNDILIKNCQLKMIKAVEEAFRWGEGYITTCPTGLIMFAVPVISATQLRGGLLSGFAIFPEMKEDIVEEICDHLSAYVDLKKKVSLKDLNLRVFSLRKVREDVSFLLKLTRRFKINDINVLQDKNARYIQQYKIANFLDDLKRSEPDIARKILDKQDEIISKVKLGDKTGAREILNEFLGSIFFESGMNFEVIKVRILELVVIISRAAVEAGVEAKELLGLNYSYLTELNKTTDIDELLVKLTDVLENFINKVSSTKGRKKKTKIQKIYDFINQNFSQKITAHDIAQVGELSVSRTIHLFKEETGLSISEYINKLRIEYGKYLLRNTDVSLADLAIETGFFDQSHFTKTFKKFESMTPSQYRRSAERRDQSSSDQEKLYAGKMVSRM